MSIAKIIGDRIRAYRNQKGWSQEYLAEKADVHHTYIGQLERGEKNATIESISKIAFLILCKNTLIIIQFSIYSHCLSITILLPLYKPNKFSMNKRNIITQQDTFFLQYLMYQVSNRIYFPLQKSYLPYLKYE